MAAKPDGKPPKPLEATVLEPAELVAALTAAEHKELAHCEDTIRGGWKSFVDVGEALLKIREGELFRDRYRSFEEYYRNEWQYQKSQVYRLIDAAKVVRVISPIGEESDGDMPRPTCEAQVRPLVSLDETQMKTAWRQAAMMARTAEKPITARLVLKQVHEVNPATRPPRRSKDHLGLHRLPVTNSMKFRDTLAELIQLVTADEEVLQRAQLLRRRLLRLVRIDPGEWGAIKRKKK